MNDPIVVVHDLTYVYGSGLARRTGLANVSLEIARGSCAAIVGITGSGKSTLIQHFNGLLQPTSGWVMVDGITIHAPRSRSVLQRLSKRSRSGTGPALQALRQRVGMLFQSPEAQLFAPTVLDDVAYGPRRLGLPPLEVVERVRWALDVVGLPAAVYGRRSPFDLSGGQMRRVALAGVLALEPVMLVLDEPTVGLDAQGQSEFYAYVRRVQRERGITVVLVSHDMAEVAALADRVFVLDAGQLVAQGTPNAIFAQGEQLRRWGLQEPPLVKLLSLLRRAGVVVPDSVKTVEEAAAVLGRLGFEKSENEQG